MKFDVVHGVHHGNGAAQDDKPRQANAAD